jgi:hypothetical protein
MWANNILAAFSVALAIFVSWNNPRMMQRAAVALAPLVCGAAAMVRPAHRTADIRPTSILGFAAAACVLALWAVVAPQTPGALLHRAVGLISVAAVLILGCAVAARRMDAATRWTSALRENVLVFGALATAAILLCAGFEAKALTRSEVVPLARWAIVALVVALGTLSSACVVVALRERFDPLQLRGQARDTYVYIAEGLGALLFLHVRATMPWLFSGLISQYWPVLVMGLAFAAAGVSEACARRKIAVLARPLGRTGLVLPVVALAEFFIQSSQVNYAIVLLTVGAFYAVLAALRRSAALAMAAALALNASLWHLLHHTPGLGLTEHPQLWFIPPALAVLAATHLNRRRLREEQRRALHYACLLAIYLSSTADIFLIGVARAPWLPLLLAGLSLAGIFVGFAFRLRSFLLLGVGFLCLSLFTMIWHAAANLGWTWVWYVCGIVLGAGIISVFAFFEKKRGEMTQWFDDLKDWAA